MPLLDSIQGTLTPALIERVAAQVKDSHEAAASGLAAAVRQTLDSLTERVDEPGFVHAVATLAASAATDPVALAYPDLSRPWFTAEFASTLSAGRSRAWAQADLLGLSRCTGVSTSSAALLLSAAAPIVLGYLGYVMRRDGLDAAGLSDLLRSEREPPASCAIPVCQPREDSMPRQQPAALPYSSRWTRIVAWVRSYPLT